MQMFRIYDAFHTDTFGDYPTFAEAVAELERFARTPWDQPPNRAPCMGWRTCGRRYEIQQHDRTSVLWPLIKSIPALEISATGTVWLLGAGGGGCRRDRFRCP